MTAWESLVLLGACKSLPCKRHRHCIVSYSCVCRRPSSCLRGTLPTRTTHRRCAVCRIYRVHCPTSASNLAGGLLLTKCPCLPSLATGWTGVDCLGQKEESCASSCCLCFRMTRTRRPTRLSMVEPGEALLASAFFARCRLLSRR